MKRAQGEFTRLQEQYKLMDRAFSELLNYFCLDRKKAPIDEFFGDLNNFLKDFEVCMYIVLYVHMCIGYKHTVCVYVLHANE